MRRMITILCKAAKRPHKPRCKHLRKLISELDLCNYEDSTRVEDGSQAAPFLNFLYLNYSMCVHDSTFACAHRLSRSN